MRRGWHLNQTTMTNAEILRLLLDRTYTPKARRPIKSIDIAMQPMTAGDVLEATRNGQLLLISRARLESIVRELEGERR